MKRIDIIGAFKIASEKGSSFEEVKASLASAGYGQQDIEDSFQAFLQGASPYEKTQPKPLPVTPGFPIQQPQPFQPVQQTSYQPAQQIPMQFQPQQGEKAPAYLLVAIVASAVIVAGLLGYVVYAILSG